MCRQHGTSLQRGGELGRRIEAAQYYNEYHNYLLLARSVHFLYLVAMFIIVPYGTGNLSKLDDSCVPLQFTRLLQVLVLLRAGRDRPACWPDR